jgi:hypothetical protein
MRRTKPHLVRQAGGWLCTTPDGHACHAPDPASAFRIATWLEARHRAPFKPKRGLRPSIDIDIVRRLLEPKRDPGDGVLRFVKPSGKSLRERIVYAYND